MGLSGVRQGGLAITLLPPLTQDMYESFEPSFITISSRKDDMIFGERLRERLQAAWLSLACVVANSSGGETLADRLKSWRQWRASRGSATSDMEVPFIERLVILARLMRDMPPMLRNCEFEPARMAVESLLSDGLASHLLQHHMDTQLQGCLTVFASFLDPKLFGEIDYTSWDPLSESQVPRIDGLVTCAAEDCSQLLNKLQGSFDDSVDPPCFDLLASSSNLLMVEDLIDAFGCTTVTVNTLGNGLPTTVSAARPHLKLHDATLRVLFSVVSVFDKMIVPGGCQLMHIVGGTAGKFEWQDGAANSVTALLKSHSELKALMKSASFDSTEVAELSTIMSLVRVRNWSCLAEKFIEAVVVYLVKQLVLLVGKEVARLRSLTPAVGQITSEGNYDRDALQQLTKQLPADSIKASICLVHSGVVHMATFVKQCRLTDGTKHEAVAPQISMAKSSLHDAKVVLALRSCGQLIFASTAPANRDIEKVLASIEKLNVRVASSILQDCQALRQ